MRRGWELVLLLVILGYIVKAAIEFIEPLVPYMLIAGVIGLIALGYYHKRQQW